MQHSNKLCALLICFFAAVWLVPLAAHSANVGQCMADCIKHEGNTASAKSTCKLRCADVPVPALNTGNKTSCMAVYKKCNRSCPKTDKTCRQDCKDVLMECK